MNIIFVVYLICASLVLVGLFNSKWGQIVPRRMKALVVIAAILGIIVDYFIWGGNNSNGFLLNQF